MSKETTGCALLSSALACNKLAYCYVWVLGLKWGQLGPACLGKKKEHLLVNEQENIESVYASGGQMTSVHINMRV